MANYDRLELLESEKQELIRWKAILPFRAWFAVKAEHNEARFFDSLRKAKNFAKKHTPAAIYAAQ
jgi:Holliday junction resolvase